MRFEVEQSIKEVDFYGGWSAIFGPSLSLSRSDFIHYCKEFEGGHHVESRLLRSFFALAFLLFGSTSIAFAQLAQPGLPSPQAGPSVPQSGSSSSSSGGGAAQSPAAPQAQSNFSGSVPGKFVPGVLPITLEGAIERGL